MHGYHFVPQSSYNNPALIPDGKVIVGIPVLSSIAHTTYSKFGFNDFFQEKSDSLYLDLNKVISKSDKANMIAEYVEHDLILIGLKIQKNYLNFGIRNRLYSRITYSEGLLKLIWNGNLSYIDEKLDLSSTSVSHDHFLDYYAGFAFKINENIGLGVRAHYLQGLSSIETQRNNISIITSSEGDNGFNFDANASFLINTSGLVYDSTDGFRFNDYAFNFTNSGFSFDIGAEIKINERVNVTLSIIDLGKINWKSNLKSFESESENVKFSGITVDIDSQDDIFEQYADSISELIDVKEFEASFSTSLPTRVYTGLEYYSLDRKNRISLLMAGLFMKEKFIPSVSVGFDRDVSKHFAFKVNYSYLPYSPLNLGAGFSFNFKPFQFYFLTDNIFSTFLWDSQRYFNLRLGINILIPEQNSIPKGEPVFRK
ncbi:MAG: hypothetical protein C0598_13930 [Marinilabiliales bacterium]|nr:MAG: hypothetical protein C0598_13930 [Marinilabiliales bacterium]